MAQHHRRRNWFGIGLIALLVGWAAVDSRLVRGDDSYARVEKGLNDYVEVFKTVTQEYFQPLEPSELAESAIEGMLGKLDPYTQFFDTRALEQLKIDTQGKFGGLGITISVDRKGFPVVRSVIEGTPADTAGLLMGDRIVAVDGDPTLGKPLENVVDVLRGDPGAPVVVTIQRVGRPEEFKQRVVRDRIGISSVLLAEEIDDGIGYISMSNVFGGTTSRFSRNTGEELEAAIRKLQGPQLKGLILDLRSNPGGLLEQAIEVADKFLPPQRVVVTTKGRTDDQNREYRTREPALLAGTIPLVVLVNGHSASASEIVAGALQDSDRGLVLGTPTFGKGSVQTVRYVGENRALKLTTAVYYTPSGRSIHKAARRAELAGGPVITVGDTLRLSAYEVMSIIGSADGRDEAVDELVESFGMTSDQALRIVEMQLGQLLGLGTRQRISPDGSDPKEEFQTIGGRTVYGGGGIAPDVEVELERPSRYFVALRNANYLFDFAVEYAATMPVPVDFESFEVGDDVIEAFRTFLADSTRAADFSYQSAAELRLGALREAIQMNELSPEAKGGLETLSKEIQREREEFDGSHEMIRRELAGYIAVRLWGTRETILSQLKWDEQFREALRILKNPDAYQKEMRVAMK